MTGEPSTIDRWCFALSGHDPSALQQQGPIAEDERSMARAYSVLIALLCATNLVCMALGFHDIFIEEREDQGLSVMLLICVLPLSGLSTLVLFGLLRLASLCVFAGGVSSLQTVLRLVIRLSIWVIFPALGILAAVPIQTRVLTDDIRLAQAIQSSSVLQAEFLKFELADATSAQSSVLHPCVGSLSRPEALLSAGQAHQAIGECGRLIAQPDAGQTTFDRAASQEGLELVRRAIGRHSVIELSAAAFEKSTGASLILVSMMMLFYSAPFLIRSLAHRRAYEYALNDKHRWLLATRFGIEVHAHDAYNHKGYGIPMTRYRGVEMQATAMRKRFEQAISTTNDAHALPR